MFSLFCNKFKKLIFCVNPIPPGLFEGGAAWKGGGGGKVPAAYNSKTFNEMKFSGVVKDHITITKSKFE